MLKRFTTLSAMTVVTGALVVGALGGGVASAHQGHGSCAGYGGAISDTGAAGIVGETRSDFASANGGLAGALDFIHGLEALCEAAP